MSQIIDNMLHELDLCCEENEIPGYPGYYTTPEGDIMKRVPPSSADDVERVVCPSLHKGDKRGHLNVRIKGVPGTAKEPYVHRLVAMTHIPNPEGKPMVCHKDDDPSNNCVDNLYWGDGKDNAADCRRNGHFHAVTPEEREIGLQKMRKRTWAEKDGVRKEYDSLNDAVRDTGVQQGNACKVIHGEREHTCGYKFGYIDD